MEKKEIAELFMKGIDTSYQYEGYYTYKLEGLDQNS